MPGPLPTLEWLHICDYAFRDEQGKLCMIGLFDSLHSVNLPGRLPIFSVAIGLTDGKGSYQVGLRIEAPGGTAVDLQLPPVQLADRRAKARAVIRLASLPFEEFGTYTFRLILEGQPVDAPVHLLEHLQLQGGGPEVPGIRGPGLPPPPDFPQG